MKFETQTQTAMHYWKNTKSEVVTKIQDGRRRHLEFHITCCRFVANCPIFTKFCRWMEFIMANLKILKPEVELKIQDGGGDHIWFYIIGYNSAKY